MPIDLRITFRRGTHVEALLADKRFNFKFIPVEPISRAFRRAIRDNEFDVTEMALVTLAMAVDGGYPWLGLPVVMMRGFHHGALRTPNDSPIHSPQDLVGRKVGVRAYSQTTGVWIRGILQHEYGVAADQINWLTTEDAHVPGFLDPSFVTRAPDGATLQSLLTSGEIAAVIGDGSTGFPDTRSVIEDPEKAAADWHQRTGVYPVNHVLAFRKELNVCRELQEAFEPADPPSKTINLGLQFAFEQGLTRQLFRYEDLFCR